MRKLALALAASVFALSGAASASAGEIAVIVKTVNSTFWQNVQKGADAGHRQAEGAHHDLPGPAAESAIADQVNMVENAVNRKVDAILLAPFRSGCTGSGCEEGLEARIPVVIIDSMLSKDAEKYYQASRHG